MATPDVATLTVSTLEVRKNARHIVKSMEGKDVHPS